MAIEPIYDVFLSHAASDTEAVAELARRLEEVGLKPFFPVQQIQVGMPWVEAIEKGLELSQSIAVFFGPGNVGPWQNEEMRAALETHVRDKGLWVIPVLLPGASLPDEESRPPIPVQLAWVDFRKGLDEPEPFHRLLAAIIGFTTRASAPGSPPLRSRLRLPRFRLPRFRFKPRLKGVWLATAAPPSVAPNSKFVARFSAYTEEYRSQVTKAVIAEAPKAKLHLDLHTCQWEPGTKVTVTLSADPLCVEEPSQSFVWNGKWEILKFDVSVLDSIDEGRLILRFDVFVEGLKIAKLRPELNIEHSQTAEKGERELEIATVPDKAFASYASLDRREVIGRIRSLQIFTHVDVFLDCLSIHPGDRWKDIIKAEIEDRDIFWLFWSRNALQSEWVDWEWRAALAAKTLDYIQPHPLEGPDVAPPPAELAALQFGSLYESFLSQMRSSWWHYRITQCRRAVRRFVGSYWLLAPIFFLVITVVYFLWFR